MHNPDFVKHPKPPLICNECIANTIGIKREDERNLIWCFCEHNQVGALSLTRSDGSFSYWTLMTPVSAEKFAAFLKTWSGDTEVLPYIN